MLETSLYIESVSTRESTQPKNKLFLVQKIEKMIFYLST